MTPEEMKKVVQELSSDLKKLKEANQKAEGFKPRVAALQTALEAVRTGTKSIAD